MRKPSALLRAITLGTLLTAGACSGSLSCSGCNGLTPIPGGFDESARIERAAQIRMTSSGLGFIERSFQDLMKSYVRMDCGAATDPPCPTDFVSLPGGAANPSSCDAARGVCVEQASGDPGPLLGFEIDRQTSSGAIVCRDEPTDPNPRRCFAYLRFEGLNLQPRAPNLLDATINAQIVSTDIPFRYDALGMDCLVRIDSGLGAQPTQDILLTASLTEWMPPSGTGGRQLKVVVDSVDAMIPDSDVDISRDPVHGDIIDIALCGVANLGVVKNALIPRLVGSLTDVVSSEIDKALGWACGAPGTEPCPSGTSCNTDGFCEEPDGSIVPTKLGFEGRLDFASLLGGLTGGRPGQGDISFLLGGPTIADAQGMTLGALGGAEVVTPDPTCATILPSPRLRPGWVAPPALPAAEMVDLDFDGTPETPYMLAAGISDAWLDQVVWSAYTTGLFCQRISAYDIDLLNTGSLSLLMPSLSLLTHSDRYTSAVFPAAVSIYPRGEPQLTLGSGKVDTSGSMPVLTEPLIDLFLDDLEVSFHAKIEDRWVRLMTVTIDMHLGLGAAVNGANAIELVIGDLGMSITDVRVTNSEILAESTADLQDTIPSLLMLALPQITGAIPSFNLPSGMELGGFEIDVLGIRGVTTAPSPNLAIYANLSFDPSLVPNLSLVADTRAELVAMDLPPAEQFAVGHGRRPRAPKLMIAVSGQVPAGRALEYQVRVDSGLWSPFFAPHDGLVVLEERPELLLEGRHQVEVRARVQGDSRSLDPTPAQVEVMVDVRPPVIDARLAGRAGGLYLHAYDVVSRDRVKLEVEVDGRWAEVVPDAEGFVPVSEVAELPGSEIAVAATDEQGLRAEVLLRSALTAGEQQATEQRAEGCHCVAPSAAVGPSSLLLALMGMAMLRARRRVR